MISLHPRPEERPDTLLEAWGGEVLSPIRLAGEPDLPPATIRFALLHRDYGVALLDLAPEERPEAAERFRRQHRAQIPASPCRR